MNHYFIYGAFAFAFVVGETPDSVKHMAEWLAPFNAAVVTLMWWRITQLEKTVEKLDTRIFELQEGMIGATKK